ncbi:hypothetical protein BJX61DRAFT_256851 [Aspergillus egyptiacus]|nr:hypothetical protein BJX61DRAFT_256851 [Aspergillus egyptiacus]
MADPVPENPKNTPSTPKFTRCRTGCLRCRKRRRKCDERKPRCQNCIDKNFDCSYGMQVTFLPKNSITVTAGERQALSVEAVGYDRIQFVNEDALSVDNTAGSTGESVAETQRSQSSLSIDSNTRRSLSPRSVNIPQSGHRYSIVELEKGKDDIAAENTNDGGQDHAYHRNLSTRAPREPDNNPHTLSANHPVTLEPPMRRNTFSAKDEFAVRGLLALGAQPGPIPGARFIPDIPDPDEVLGPQRGLGFATEPVPGPGTPLRLTPSRTVGGDMPVVVGGIVGVSTPAAHSDPDLEMRNMKLLQHYRYDVAPWLDICDLNHPFGIAAVQMAVNSTSESLFPALMALSKACLQRSSSRNIGLQPVLSDNTRGISDDRQGHVDMSLRSDLTELMLLRVFEELRLHVLDLPSAWAEAREREYGLLQSLVYTAYGLTLESAIYWVFLRIDLGTALANDTPIGVPLPSMPIPSLALLCRTEGTAERVGHYAQVLLWLCGKTITIYHQDSHSHSQQNQVPNRDSWLQIFEELTKWHYFRPQEFQPMVEVADDKTLNPESQFPMLLFTNGAGALCNQLYHTAMLLMLECKPRTTLLSNAHRSQSPALSPLWHAQRVCGIALNNDRCECWDPCLLASFLVAARRMTHESQHVEIVQGFERVQALTGWSVGEYLMQLREEWSFLDGC